MRVPRAPTGGKYPAYPTGGLPTPLILSVDRALLQPSVGRHTPRQEGFHVLGHTDRSYRQRHNGGDHGNVRQDLAACLNALGPTMAMVLYGLGGSMATGQGLAGGVENRLCSVPSRYRRGAHCQRGHIRKSAIMPYHANSNGTASPVAPKGPDLLSPAFGRSLVHSRASGFGHDSLSKTSFLATRPRRDPTAGKRFQSAYRAV